MTNIQPISKEKYSKKSWQRPSSLLFTAGDVVCQLSAHELKKGTMSLPIAFMSNEEKYTLVSIQGLELGQNLFITADGRWLNRYVPVAYRCYPFKLIDAGRADKQKILCIDEDSDIVTDGDEGELFFTEDGELAPLISQTLNLLTQASANAETTSKICELLDKHKLIKPWEIKLQREEREQTLQGLHCIDETVLSSISGKVLKELQGLGALQTAYCQLLSMQHMTALPQLAQAHAKAAKQAASPNQAGSEILLDTSEDNGSINFDNL